jgi:hypothetical protein
VDSSSEMIITLCGNLTQGCNMKGKKEMSIVVFDEGLERIFGIYS